MRQLYSKTAIAFTSVCICLISIGVSDAQEKQTQRSIYAQGHPIVSSGGNKDVAAIIWEDGEYGFVRIVQAEAAAQGSNDHPVTLTPEQIHNILSNIQVQEGNKKPKKLFLDSELDRLADPLAEALSKAGPNQDVTFAVSGRKGGGIGPFNPLLVTTGRVFYQDNRLNLIFGIVNGQFEGQMRATGYLRDFTPGSRSGRVEKGWAIVPTATQYTYANGRGDWIQDTLTPAAGYAASAPAAGPRQAQPPTYGAGATTATQRGAVSAPASQSSTADTPPQYGEAYYQEMENRLKGLRRLREQDLITEEEYQRKRKEIIDNL